MLESFSLSPGSQTRKKKGPGEPRTRRVDDEHLGTRRDRLLELVKVDGPLGGRQRLDSAFLGRMHRNVDNLAPGHLNVADVPTKCGHVSSVCAMAVPRLALIGWPNAGAYLLVKEGLENDDLIAGLDEGHERTEHAYTPIRVSG